MHVLSVKEESKYAYSFGVVKELERLLLTKDKFDRLIEAKNIQELMALLSETPYGEVNTENFENVLAQELKRVYLDFIKLAPDKQFIDFFFLEYEFHNLKVLLKAKLQEKLDVEQFFIDVGEAGKEKFSALLKLELSDIIKQLENYKEIIQEVATKFEQVKDPRIIENILDRALFEKMYSYADGSELLKDIVNIYADMANLKIAIRSENLARAKDLIVFVSRGKLTVKELHTLYEKGLEYLVSTMSRYYEKIIPLAVEYYEREHSWLLLEKLIDDYIIKKLKERTYCISVEPLIGYILAKKTEIKLLRMLIVSKLANIGIESLKVAWREL
jgi:V/A-type H+-transporting ATPase subunit C